MRITKIEIVNYKSFLKSGEVSFQTGINLIVGKNNAGKSALMQAISLNFSRQPHLSAVQYPSVESPINPITSVTCELQFSGQELRPLLLNQAGSNFLFAWPDGVAPTETNSYLAAVDRILSEPDLRAAATKAISSDVTAWSQPNTPGLRGYPTKTHANRQMAFEVRPSKDRSTFEFSAGPVETDVRGDVGVTAVHLLLQRIYVFRAERRGSDACNLQWKLELAPDASNLADVLHTLSQNPIAFAEYEDLVRQVFPNVAGFSVQNLPSNLIEVRIWLTPKSTKRLDLTIPLSECGSGIAQVLAIVYVITQSRTPQVIAIDEPNSFLHPDASRALIQVVKKFPQHQYIFTTHSPEIIAESGAANLIVLKHTDGQSRLHQYDGGELTALREALATTGARLSDVFGYDRVLWVEGPSDASVFEWLSRQIDPNVRNLAIRPVRSTGDFDPASIDQAVDVYRSLSHADALLPVTIAFLFDREKRPSTEIEDAKRRKDAVIGFLSRRMLENYFLDPRTIADLFGNLTPPLSVPPDVQIVTEWIAQQASKRERNPAATLSCHGKNLLKDAFAHFTKTKYEYIEVTHLPLLAKLQLNVNKGPLIELACSLVEVGACSTEKLDGFAHGRG